LGFALITSAASKIRMTDTVNTGIIYLANLRNRAPVQWYDLLGVKGGAVVHRKKHPTPSSSAAVGGAKRSRKPSVAASGSAAVD